MDTTSKATQFKAGFFVLLGLISIGSLVLYFGRFGESIKRFYPLTVEYRNASGIFKGADVLLAGARIGEVADAPKVLPNMRGVAVKLNVDETVQIPEGSVFSIGSSGLLGDRFITVTMSDNAVNQKPIEPGSVITNGVSESSIAELQRQIHDEILPKLNNALGNINGVTETLKNDIFNPEGVKNVQDTLANFRTTSQALADSSGQIKNVADQANLFLKRGNSAMASVDGVAGDLRAFIINLRQHGIIFYRDTTPVVPVKKSN
jgi:ABC-type transporter Mla subunit MlaD